MPKARVQSVDTSDLQSKQELLHQLGMDGTGKYDLIHMQDWTMAMNFLPSLLPELDR